MFFLILPVLFIYPLFSWWSQILEHRWYVEFNDQENFFKKELIHGRPTVYPGLLGIFLKYNLFPFSDSYHLAHSMYPFVRYNYLAKIDKILFNFNDYKANASYGFIKPLNKTHESAFSELYKRLVTNTH